MSVYKEQQKMFSWDERKFENKIKGWKMIENWFRECGKRCDDYLNYRQSLK